MKTRLLTGPEPSDPHRGLVFYCPGCQQAHMYCLNQVIVDGKPTYPQGLHQWEWDGNEESPTLGPSLLIYPHPGQPRCHLFLKAGMLQYCTDCDHPLAGKTVPLPDIPKESGWAD